MERTKKGWLTRAALFAGYREQRAWTTGPGRRDDVGRQHFVELRAQIGEKPFVVEYVIRTDGAGNYFTGRKITEHESLTEARSAFTKAGKA